MATLSPSELRSQIRTGQYVKPTSGVCGGYLQAKFAQKLFLPCSMNYSLLCHDSSMVILDKSYAADFKRFCELNHQACPLLTMLGPGEKEPKELAPGANITTDLPQYRVWKNGQLVEEVSQVDPNSTRLTSLWQPTDIKHLWNDDLVTFLLGCSFSFEKMLLDSGIPVRNIEQVQSSSSLLPPSSNRIYLEQERIHVYYQYRLSTLRPI